MDFKQQLFSQAMRLMQDPRVSKALQNPTVMQGLVGAMQLGNKVQHNVDQGLRQLAKQLNLATESEVAELRETISRLQQELDEQRRPPVD